MHESQEQTDQPWDGRTYCCSDIERQLLHTCNQHEDPFDCPDQLIFYNITFNEYGLIVHDGGSSSVLIRFCPWCGAQLPSSLRGCWFTELEACGIEPSDETAIPIAYRSDQWYRRGNES